MLMEKRSDRLVSVHNAAHILGRSTRQLRRMIHEGRITAVFDSNRYYIQQSILDAYMHRLYRPKKEPKQ